MTKPDEALLAAEADALLQPLANFDAVLLAVSGGADSLALLYLVSEWTKRRGSTAPAISVATVDHQLRAASAAEASTVAGHCAKLGIDHTTLVWQGEKPERGIANAARDARYALLSDHARRIWPSGRTAIVTAHHQDDQAETLVMRLARGSGVDGLAAIAPQRVLSSGSDIALVRPLLAIPKSRLAATLKAHGIDWIEDPSNLDSAYERVRVRQALTALSAAGVEPAALAMTARRMGDARDALAFATEAFKVTLSLSFNNEIFASFDRDAFERAPALLRGRVLRQLIERFGGDSAQPSLGEIEDLVAHLAAKPRGMMTLGGSVVSLGKRFVRIWREVGRMTAPAIDLAPGQQRLWDNRFWVASGQSSHGLVTVKPLGREAYVRIAAAIAPRRRPPPRAAVALPSFWTGSDLLAVPALAHFESRFTTSGANYLVTVRAEPAFTS